MAGLLKACCSRDWTAHLECLSLNAKTRLFSLAYVIDRRKCAATLVNMEAKRGGISDNSTSTYDVTAYSLQLLLALIERLLAKRQSSATYSYDPKRTLLQSLSNTHGEILKVSWLSKKNFTPVWYMATIADIAFSEALYRCQNG